ncbi:hypothetical protein GQ600_25595 [Phytophthora cactorum]|nr:hypothetical protein GQ600_25595 [Phytophthora cactorum]
MASTPDSDLLRGKVAERSKKLLFPCPGPGGFQCTNLQVQFIRISPGPAVAPGHDIRAPRRQTKVELAGLSQTSAMRLTRRCASRRETTNAQLQTCKRRQIRAILLKSWIPIVAATCVISAERDEHGRKFRRTACPFKLVAKSVYNDSKWEVEVTCPNAEHIHSETTREPAAPASETQPKPLIQSFPVEGLKGNPSIDKC